MIGEIKALQTLTAHKSDINSVDFARDCVLVTGSGDKLVRVWRWQPGDGYVEAEFSPLRGHKYGVTSVKVSPQSSMLASTSIDGTSLLWNLQTGGRIFKMVQPGGESVRVCRFSPDSTLLATAGDNGQVCIWDLVRRVLVRSFQKHEGAVQSVCFSPDSNWLVTSCTLGVLNLFHTAEIDNSFNDDATSDVTVYDSVDDAHDLGVVCCDISNSQRLSRDDCRIYHMVTCGNDHNVKLWQITVISNKIRCSMGYTAKIELDKVLEKHSSALTCVRFSANALYIASCGLDKTTVLWETDTGKAIATVSGHNRYVACCAFSRDGKLLATGSNDKSVIVWDLTGKLAADSELVRSTKTFDKITKHEQDLMENAESLESDVRLVQKFDEHCGAVNSLAVYGNHLIVSGSGDKQIRLWTNQPVEIEEAAAAALPPTEEQRGREELNEEQEKVETDEESKTVQFDTEHSKKTAMFRELPYSPLEGHNYSVNHVDFSPCGRMIVSCSLDGTSIVWNSENGTQLGTTLVNSGYGIRVCRWSPDGTRIATAGDDERATLWSVKNMDAICTFENHADAVNTVAFTHDSRYLVSACNEGAWKLFDTFSGSTALLTCEEAHDLGVQSSDFSPTSVTSGTVGRQTAMDEGQQKYLLATSGNDSLVKLWEILVHSNVCRTTSAEYKLKKSLIGHGGNVTSVRFSPVHGEVLGSVATDRTARIWSVFAATCLYVLEDHASLVTACAFSGDTSLFVTGSLDKTILVWQLPQQLVSQGILLDSLRHRRKKVTEWGISECSKWLHEIGLPSLAKSAQVASLTGRLLLSLSAYDIASKLRFNESLEALQQFQRELYWLKCEDSSSSNTEPMEDTIPHEFLCPITHEIMKEPVKCSDGFTYERAAITEWFLCGRYSSPTTNEILQDTILVPNIVLRSAIYEFLYGNGPSSSATDTSTLDI